MLSRMENEFSVWRLGHTLIPTLVYSKYGTNESTGLILQK